MLRILAGAVVGAVVWFVVVSILNYGLRFGWHDYAAVEKAMAFTLPMMVARLTESGIASIAGGMAAATIGRDRMRPSLAAGILLFIPFAYWHYVVLWAKFPLWYHLTFLSSLVVLSVVGGHLVRVRRRMFQPA
jgi:hypothetical protein